MSEAKDQEISRLKQDLIRMSEIAEQHAHSVRQVAAQRERYFKIFDLLGPLAKFNNGTSLSEVSKAVQITGSQFLQDIFPLLFSAGKSDGFFVEFGACDGLLISNTVLLERNFGWKGILSEPSRSWHESLKKNRNCILDFRCVHGETGKTVQFAEFSDDAYGTQSAVIEGDRPEAVKRIYDVETISLRDLLKEHQAPRTIDLISIDVEGGEYDIIKNFPFDEYRFEFACVEQMTEEQSRRIRSVFEKAGYKQVLDDISGHDGYYVPADSEAFRVIEGLKATRTVIDKADEPFWNPWYKDTTFTTDWSSRAFENWSRYLSNLKNHELNILEVGAWEGRGSIFFLNYFEKSHITCIDIFTLGNEDLFDRNVISKYSDRVRKLKGRSSHILDGLSTEKQNHYDVIYLDGSHDTDDVMVDSLLSWPLLKVGGIMIWDDYLLTSAMPGCFDPHQDPKPAIDTFLEWKLGSYEILSKEYQIIIRKIDNNQKTV